MFLNAGDGGSAVFMQREVGLTITAMLCAIGACFFLVRRGRAGLRARRRRVVEIGARNNRPILSSSHSSGGFY